MPVTGWSYYLVKGADTMEYIDATTLRQTKEAYHIGMLQKIGPPGELALDMSLQAYTDEKLFQVGLYSGDHWATIMNFLSVHTPQSDHAGQQLRDNGNAISQVPAEIHHLYLDLMNVVDLTKMAGTSKFYHEVANGKISRWIDSFFAIRDIKWDEFRFAIFHTDVILSGMAVNHLLFPGGSARTTVQSKKIECYLTEETLAPLKQYLDVATNYKWISNVANPRHLISKRVIYIHKNPIEFPFKIILNVCEDNDPEAAVVRQKFTAKANWLSADGLMVLDTYLTLGGYSLPVRKSFSLETAVDLETFRRKKMELSDNGIRLLTYHDPAFARRTKGDQASIEAELKENGDKWHGRCSGNPTCPSRSRNTEDGDSFFAAFQRPVLGREARCRGQKIGLAWSLGNTGCDGIAPAGTFANSYKISRNTKEDVWLARYENETIHKDSAN